MPSEALSFCSLVLCLGLQAHQGPVLRAVCSCLGLGLLCPESSPESLAHVGCVLPRWLPKLVMFLVESLPAAALSVWHWAPVDCGSLLFCHSGTNGPGLAVLSPVPAWGRYAGDESGFHYSTGRSVHVSHTLVWCCLACCSLGSRAHDTANRSVGQGGCFRPRTYLRVEHVVSEHCGAEGDALSGGARAPCALRISWFGPCTAELLSTGVCLTLA